jgi:membrane protease subunit (stomatin/prohibitin family)
MGLFDKLKNELVDIIEWVDNTSDTMVWKFPRYQDEIKMNAKLTVRESQVAIFLNEGKIADVYAHAYNAKHAYPCHIKRLEVRI